MKNNTTFAARLLRGAAIALVAAGSTALVAEEEQNVSGDALSLASPQAKKPAPQPAKKPAPQPVKNAAPLTHKFGAFLSYAMPQGDLGSVVGAGFGLGGFWEMPFTQDLKGVASVQYLTFAKKKEGMAGFAEVESSAAALGLNYDVNYHFVKELPGLYGLAGVGYHNCEMTVKSTMPYIGSTETSESEGKIGFSVGAGYYFTDNLGAEARYFAGADDWTWLQLSVKYRF